MISATAYRLRCEAHCGTTIDFNMRDVLLTIKEVREKAEVRGWRVYLGKDYCPEHAEAFMTPDRWNAEHEIGTLVQFWPGARHGVGRVTRTRSKAFSASSRTPVIFLEAYPSYVALSHVEPTEEP